MRRPVPALSAAAGVIAIGLSFAIDAPAPAYVRLAGIALLTGAGLTAAPRATRELLSAVVRAFSGRTTAIALLVIVGAAVVCRLVWIDLDARYDEAYTFLIYGILPVADGMESYRDPNNHLLHTLLLHGSWRLFGSSLEALRLPALLAGIAVVPATFVAGRALYGRDAGLVAAALAAGSAVIVEYSVNARGYTMTWLAFLVLIGLATRLVRGHDPAAWTLFVATGVLGFYAVPTMALPWASVVAWLAISFVVGRHPRRLGEVAAAAAVTGLLTLLLYLTLLDEPGWDYAFAAPDVLDLLRGLWRHVHLGLPAAAQIVLGAMAVAGIALHRRVGLHRVPLPLVALGLAPLLFLALPDPPPFVRSWAYLAPVEFIAVGAGVAALVRDRDARRWVPAGAAALAIAVAAVTAIGRAPYAADDAPIIGGREAAAWMKLQPAGTTFVVWDFSTPNWTLTFRNAGVPDGTIRTKYEPAQPPPVLVISRTRGERIGERLASAGVPPDTTLRLEARFGEVDLYRVP